MQAANTIADPALADAYALAATVGLDVVYPFSRNAEFAAGRFSLLGEAITDANLLTPEPGGSADIARIQQLVRSAVAEIGEIIAQATLDEAISNAISDALISMAQTQINDARLLVASGDYLGANSGYRDATILLLPALQPSYNIPTPSTLDLLSAGALALMLGCGWKRVRRRCS